MCDRFVTFDAFIAELFKYTKSIQRAGSDTKVITLKQVLWCIAAKSVFFKIYNVEVKKNIYNETRDKGMVSCTYIE